MSTSGHCLRVARAGLVLLLWLANPGFAAFIGVGWSAEDSPVYTIDELTGEYALLGYSGFRGLNSLAASGPEDFLAVATYTDESFLVRLDPQTGHGTLISPLSIHDVRALSFSPAGELFAALGGGRVATIDPQTGSVSVLARTPYPFIQGLAFAADGGLYGWDLEAGLLAIDPITGVALDLQPNIGAAVPIQTLAFGPDGELYGARERLFRIDVQTGLVTPWGTGLYPDLRGLEAIIPEPASGLLLVSGGLAGWAVGSSRRLQAGCRRRT